MKRDELQDKLQQGRRPHLSSERKEALRNQLARRMESDTWSTQQPISLRKSHRRQRFWQWTSAASLFLAGGIAALIAVNNHHLSNESVLSTGFSNTASRNALDGTSVNNALATPSAVTTNQTGVTSPTAHTNNHPTPSPLTHHESAMKATTGKSSQASRSAVHQQTTTAGATVSSQSSQRTQRTQPVDSSTPKPAVSSLAHTRQTPPVKHASSIGQTASNHKEKTPGETAGSKTHSPLRSPSTTHNAPSNIQPTQTSNTANITNTETAATSANSSFRSPVSNAMSWLVIGNQVFTRNMENGWTNVTPTFISTSAPFVAESTIGQAVAAVGVQTDAGIAIETTTDSGADWSSSFLPEPPGTNLLQLDVASATTEYALVSNSVGPSSLSLLVSSDSGATWQTIPVPGAAQTSTVADAFNSNTVPALSFADSQTGYLVDPATNALLKTTDGAVTWSAWSPSLTAPKQVPTGAIETPLGAPTFFGDEGVWSVLWTTSGHSSVLAVYQTMDGGRSFVLTSSLVTRTPVLTPADVQATFVSPSVGWLLDAHDNMVWSTSDAGHTWNTSTSTVPLSTLTSVVPESPTTGYALEQSGPTDAQIVTTTDAGHTWLPAQITGS